MSLPKENIFRKIYNLYSKDLTSVEFERLLLKDTPEKYRYYIRSMEKQETHKNKVFEFFTFSKNFAIAFLKKLTPVIRIVYSASVFIFFMSWLQGNWNMAILSFIVLNLLIMFEIADKLTARDELEVASDVQKSLIPDSTPEDNVFETVYYYETAKEVGGDFLDFIERKDGSYLISIGDISGKGMSAALYMLQVRLLLRYLTEQILNPKCILISLNRNIFTHIKKNLYFSITLAEVKGKEMKVCRAGHTPLLYYNSVQRNCYIVKQNGMAVGLNNTNLFENSIEEINLSVNKDDIVVFYSDGLTETMNTSNSEFGLDRLKEIVIANSHKTAEEIKKIILSEVTNFRGYAEVHDDITMILMKAK